MLHYTSQNWKILILKNTNIQKLSKKKKKISYFFFPLRQSNVDKKILNKNKKQLLKIVIKKLFFHFTFQF